MFSLADRAVPYLLCREVVRDGMAPEACGAQVVQQGEVGVERMGHSEWFCWAVGCTLGAGSEAALLVGV